MDKVHGIGAWSEKEFVNGYVMSFAGRKTLLPIFSYTAYANMTDQDIADLWVYLDPFQKVLNRQLIMIFQFTFVEEAQHFGNY